MPAYSRLPVAFARGEGAWLWDTEGRQYLDALSGVAVCALGHAHPAVARALCEQAGELIHTSNWYRIPLQEELGERLCALAGMDTAFFGNSGAEANEAAIKLARRFGHDRGVLNPAIVVTEGSFHGRTLATLSATGNRKVQAGFEPLVRGFNRAPFNDLEAVDQVGENNPDVVAVLVEPIQGESGIILPDAGYLKGLREICDRRGWLLMLDEIQTGMGRSGRWFACEHEGVRPDVITVAKALGNGVPIGACLARGEAAQVLQPGHHGSTFGGNPLACRAALAVIDTLEKERLVPRAAELGKRILDGLKAQLDGAPHIVELRGRGLLLAVELDHPCPQLAQVALEQGLLINIAGGNTVRLLPPYILSDDEADELVTRLVTVLNGYIRH